MQLDHGLEVITEHIAKTTFPWLMSNVVDNETGRPLGSGKNTHVIEHNGIKVGIMGLVEKEWLDTLPTIDPKEVTYTDFIKTGNKLATQLRNEVCLRHRDTYATNECWDFLVCHTQCAAHSFNIA